MNGKPFVFDRSYECWVANEGPLKDLKHLKKFLYIAASYCNAKPAAFWYKKFEEGGQGITAFLVVEESFMGIETWPELYHFYVKARLCGHSIKIDGLEKAIKECFPDIKEMIPYQEQKI